MARDEVISIYYTEKEAVPDSLDLCDAVRMSNLAKLYLRVYRLYTRNSRVT
jgi:hypothetical protein